MQKRITKIVLTTETAKSVPYNQFLGYEGEDNIAELVFEFEDGFVDGRAKLVLLREDMKPGYVDLERVGDTYVLPVKSALISKNGDITFCLTMIDANNKIIAKYDPFVMTVKDAPDTDIPMPEDYPTWQKIMDDKLNEINEALEKMGEIEGGGVGKQFYVDGQPKGEIFNDYENNVANNLYSHAEGKGCEATGENSHAQNRKAKARGKHSHAQNYDTLAQGESSTAMGVQTKAYNKGSVAEGNMSEAGDSKAASDVFNPAHAEGEQTKAIGYASHAEGQRTDAIGNTSHTEGQFTQALKEASHSEGRNVIVDGDYAHGEGLDNELEGTSSHIEGQYNEVKGEASHGEGSSTAVKADFSHVEGIGSRVYDKASHSEGAGSIAGRKPSSSGGGSGGSGDDDGEGNIPEGIDGIWAAHAEGMETKAIGKASHSEGTKTQAFSDSAHGEGKNTLAYGEASHTEGGWTQTGELDEKGEHRGTTGNYAHAEGFDTRAVGEMSHSEGEGTVAKGKHQHVQGRYNLIDKSDVYAHIVGCGTADTNRRNAYTLDWSGNAMFRGALRVNQVEKVATEGYVQNLIIKLEARVKELEDKLA